METIGVLIHSANTILPHWLLSEVMRH